MILTCSTDFSSGSSHAVGTATALATRLEAHDLWFVHVLDPTLRTLDAATYAQATARAEARLQDVVRDVQQRTGLPAQVRVLEGAVSDTLPILAVAQQLVAHGQNVRILAGPGLQPDRPPRPASAAFLDGVRAIGATLGPFHQAHDPFAGISAVPV